jgi:hypothetical protein
MKQEIRNNYIAGSINPTDYSDWDQVPLNKLIGLGGLVTGWFTDYCYDEVDKPIVEHMGLMYGFGMYEMTGGTIDEDLIHHFPGDPQLHPAFHLKAKHNGAEMVCYQHAIFAFRDKPEDEWYVTRMD